MFNVRPHVVGSSTLSVSVNGGHFGFSEELEAHIKTLGTFLIIAD